MNLYMTSQLANFENFIDTDTGEIDIVSYDIAKIALKDKQLAVVCYLKNEVVSINMLDNAIKELTERKKSMQARHDGLKDYLLINMQAHGISEIRAQDSTFSAKIKKNPPKLVIDDDGEIPCELYIYPEAPAPYPNNAAIKAKLLSGEIVAGAHIEQAERVEIK